MPDDDDDKIRRNLVMTSSAVLIFFWLDLPPGAITTRILGVEYEGSIPAWKIWSSLLAVLIYFSVRFYFAARKSKTFEAATADFGVLVKVEREALINRHFQKAKRAKSTNNTILQQIDPSTGDPAGTNGSTTELVDWPSVIPGGVRLNENPWAGFLTMVTLEHGLVRSTSVARATITGRYIWECHIRAILKLKSKEPIPEIVVPVLLDYFATLNIMYALSAALLA